MKTIEKITLAAIYITFAAFAAWLGIQLTIYLQTP